jgi:flavin reductase (DIM6/NTAB) family NADH-FMN oxidoreductase RutF
MTQEVMGCIEERELRHAFGTFATGVTVVTTRTDDGVPLAKSLTRNRNGRWTATSGC